MNQKTLLKISLTLSLLGIFLLLLLSNILEPKLTKISEINSEKLNQKTKIRGTIIKIDYKRTFQILSVKDSTGKIEVLVNSNNIFQFQKNQKITVIGKIQDYKEKLQISADKINSIK